MAVRREYIAQQYRDLLGREGAEHEISGWENAADENTVRQMFLGSPEYTSRHGGQATWQDVGGVVTPTNAGGYQTQNGTPPPQGWQQPQNPILPIQTTAPNAPPAGSGAGSGDHRDQWSGEGSVPISDQFGAMTGYDLTNWNNPQMQTLKYQAGRIGSRYNPADPNALNLLTQDADFRRMFPNARIVDHRSGTIDFGNGQVIDMIQNFGAPNAKWAWQPQGSGGSGAGSGGSGSSSGTSGTLGDLRQLFGQLGQQYGGPGGPGITTGPLQQVGQDPLSQLITGALAGFIGSGGTTPFGQGLERALMSMINGGRASATGSGRAADDGMIYLDPREATGFDGQVDLGTWEPQDLLDGGGTIEMSRVGPDESQIARRFESARELLDKGRRTMINDLEGDLVSRNLLSEPGIPQGIHAGGLQRITERIAPEFSRALRDIYTDEVERSDARQLAALQMATGYSVDQARNFLAGIGEGTARQTALADIALRTLQTNMAWSQFLANFGLQRDQVLAMLQQGRVDDVQELLNSFLSLASLSRGGYIGN